MKKAHIKTVPEWNRIIIFGNFFIATSLIIGIAHVFLQFFGYRDYYGMAAAFLSGISIHVGIRLGKYLDNIKITVMVYYIALLAFGHYSFAMGAGDGTGAYWCFLQPMIVMYVLGIFYGTIYVIIQLAVLCIYFYAPFYSCPWPYTRAETIFIPMAYVSLSIITFFSQWQLWKTGVEQKRLIEEAQNADASKSDFLANMSHEIRTPLNVVIGMCEMTLKEKISEEARENVNNALVAGNNLLGIINDILDFSKMDSGKMEMIETPYSMENLLREVISLAESRRGEKNLEFMVDCDPNLPSRLIGDEVRIRQILLNLLTNAIKYTREGGVLFTISFRRESYGVNLRFSVKDSGIGIKKENLKKIFTSFSQVDARKNREVEGSGLGLPIARRLAEAMNGFIRVSSVYGEGSEFTLIIPQKIEDDTPIVSLKDREHFCGIFYFNYEKFTHAFQKEGYRQIGMHAMEKLKLSCDEAVSREDVERTLQSGKAYTHFITAREEYLECRDLVEKISTDMRVIVIQSRYGRVSLAENMISVDKPFSIVPLVDAINFEEKDRMMEEDKKEDGLLCAPTARILIVDDNMINLKVAMRLLQPYQVQMEYAQSGKDAVFKMEHSERFDLLFLDHMMPGMDGVETAHEIRNLGGEYYSEIPIVALTANTVSGVKEMFLANGFQDYISKPVEINQLEHILRKWLPKEKLNAGGEG